MLTALDATAVRHWATACVRTLEAHRTAVVLLEFTTMLRGGPPTMVSEPPPL